MNFYLKTLGELSLYRLDEPGEPILAHTKPLVVLALLATNPRYTARRDHLAELLWPGSDHSRARRSLRQALFYLSKHAGDPLVESDDSSSELALDAARLRVDLWEFDRALEERDYERALELYGGRFLAGSEDKAGIEVEHWIEAQNSRIQVGLEVAYTKTISRALEGGDTARAVRYARAYAELNPLNEQAQITLVRALKSHGDEVGALAVYQSYRTLLERELDEEPPEDLQETMERIRAAVLETPQVPEPASPGPGDDGSVEAEAGIGTREPAAERDVETEVPAAREERPASRATPPGPEPPPRAAVPPSGEPERTVAKIGSGPGPRFHGLVRWLEDRWRFRLPDPVSISIIAAAAVALVALIVVGARAFWNPGPDPSRDSLADLSGRIGALVGEGNATDPVEVRFEGDGVEIQPVDLDPSELPSPDGNLIAFTQRAPDGWNLAARDPNTGEIRTLTDRPGDEYPEAWSPDSRHLVYSEATLLEDGRSYRHHFMAHDLETREQRRLTRISNGSRIAAVWSPDGTRISFVADLQERPEVFVVDFDGDNLISVSAHRGSDTEPAWSPDGSRLAFVSDRTGKPEVFTVRPDGTDLRQVTSTQQPQIRTPTWLDESRLAFVAATGRGFDLWALDLTSGRLRRLTDRGDLWRIRQNWITEPRSWIDRLRIEPRVRVASPGEYLLFDADLLDSQGAPVMGDNRPIRWQTTDSTIAIPVERGAIRILEAGRAQIIANLRGWRADTLIVISIPLIEREIEAVFLEDWSGGLDPDRWVVFGEPEPTARSDGGPEGAGVFANNGDTHFRSGAVTTASFTVGDSGIAVQAYGRMRFTGKLFQAFALALYPETPDDTTDWVETRPLIEFVIQGPSKDPARAWIATRERQSDVPFPQRPGDWHLYTLQITPWGNIELVIDGTLHWRSTWQLAVGELDRVRVGLGYHSFETEILHGPVRVYPLPRYFLIDLLREVAE